MSSGYQSILAHHVRFEPDADLLARLAHDCGDGVLAGLDLSGWQVPLAIGVTGALPLCQQDVVATGQNQHHI